MPAPPVRFKQRGDAIVRTRTAIVEGKQNWHLSHHRGPRLADKLHPPMRTAGNLAQVRFKLASRKLVNVGIHAGKAAWSRILRKHTMVQKRHMSQLLPWFRAVIFRRRCLES